MSVPKLVELNKTEIVRLNLNLAKLEDVPIEKILSYMTQLSYQKEKFELSPPDYPFEMSVGASNYKDAFELLSRDANYGHALSLFELGQMYENGLGVEKNSEEAFQLFMKSAEQSYLITKYKVRLYYLQEKVVHQNYQLAMDWLTKTALRGSAQVQFVLGTIV